MTIQEYIDSINKRYKLGNATEHTFRGDLQQLIESLVPTIRATNEPKRQSCGAPDYILTKKDIPIGFIEAKDIGDKDLDGVKKTGNKEQFDRYKTSLNNIFFTDYIDFHLYRDGQFVTKIAIAELTDKGIKPLTENFESFERLLKDFCTNIGQTITSSKKLAEMMAGKARLLSEVIEKALTSDETHNEDSTLKDQMNAFKQILIHDITPKGFADVYAQTIAYGMFAARYHDPTLPTFSRQEAYELIPKSNPFLKKLFGYIAGLDLDDRIKWIVDDLVNIFLACDVAEILRNYGKSTKMEDPIIHFYETFLSEYDPKLRKARGVWYTPAPVVNFIVRAVDDILKTEFDLPQGLADSSKTKIKVNQQGKDIEQEVHKVQILDPATGTGTFLAEVVKHIYNKGFKNMQGLWSNYVETNLLPRLNGFELLMASYAMAHLKLDMLLTETGYKPTSNQRLRVYLTNSLEEQHPDTGTLWANWLSAEANEANYIKRDAPIMCVIGNPPYAVSSSNKSQWIEKLIADYKKDLNEKSYNSLSDDYVKFIRYGQHFIDKNGSGILAYISNNSFIDGIVHRQMRKNLLESFDTIYILDLHGNAKKKEICIDGSADQNVFDIMQGVSINIFVKTGKKKKSEFGKVLHYELQGRRDFKYVFLNDNFLKTINWNKIENKAINFFYTNKNFEGQNKYSKGFSIFVLMKNLNPGVESGRDDLFVGYTLTELKEKIEIVFKNKNNPDMKNKFGIKNSDSFKFERNLENSEFNLSFIKKINYRPFDIRFTYYDTKLQRRPSFETFKHIINGSLGLVIKRGFDEFNSAPIFISNAISDRRGWTRSGMQGAESITPLYLYLAPQHDIFAGTEKEKIKLQHKLEQAEEHFKMVSKFFHTTIEPFFKKLKNPDETNISLFEENKSLYEEAQTAVEHLKSQIKNLEENKGKIAKAILEEPVRVPNLNSTIVKQIAETLDLTFTNEKETTKNTFAPIDILDYIYAVLHSPSYREKYKEFLKIDFPRVPYPKDKETFWQLVKLGGELRQIHLLESPVVENYITQYPVDGNHTVTKVKYQAGRVYINDTQYFDSVPEVAWNFYIGGYQPAQKWLKDRKDRKLEFDDLLHYQKIIVALTETDRLMKQIDTIENE